MRVPGVGVQIREPTQSRRTRCLTSRPCRGCFRGIGLRENLANRIDSRFHCRVRSAEVENRSRISLSPRSRGCGATTTRSHRTFSSPNSQACSAGIRKRARRCCRRCSPHRRRRLSRCHSHNLVVLSPARSGNWRTRPVQCRTVGTHAEPLACQSRSHREAMLPVSSTQWPTSPQRASVRGLQATWKASSSVFGT